MFDTAQLGAGYGKASRAGDLATAVALDLGLELDQTYTAKAFAQVLELLNRAPSRAERHERPIRILYWHTLAATPLGSLLRAAPTETELPRSLQQLFR